MRVGNFQCTECVLPSIAQCFNTSQCAMHHGSRVLTAVVYAKSRAGQLGHMFSAVCWARRGLHCSVQSREVAQSNRDSHHLVCGPWFICLQTRIFNWTIGYVCKTDAIAPTVRTCGWWVLSSYGESSQVASIQSRDDACVTSATTWPQNGWCTSCVSSTGTA